MSRPSPLFVHSVWALCALLLSSCSTTLFGQQPAAPQGVTWDAARPPAAAVGPNGCSPRGCSPVEGLRSDASQLNAARPAFVRPPHPLKGIESKEIAKRVNAELASLGSMSFGGPTRGAQINAVELPDDDRWVRVDIAHSWGTAETIENIHTVVSSVHHQFPNTPKLYVGDISGPHGGHLRPHLSHQSGKDVDLGYYYTRKVPWYTRATSRNLDRPRTWALVRALIAETDVRYIFMDRRVQRMLRAYAESIGENPEWLSSIFGGSREKGEAAILRHEPGHATHLHARFYSPIAEETARICYRALLRSKKMLPSTYNSVHRVKRGETLLGLARRYRTTVRAIQRANGLRNSRIQASRNYYIPHRGPPSPPRSAQLPPRRVPPARGRDNPPAGHMASR